MLTSAHHFLFLFPSSSPVQPFLTFLFLFLFPFLPLIVGQLALISLFFLSHGDHI
ncbi:hypothetical protein RchiOBHm_Chr1g0339471 [Rosa chinensis]|uniref:Uncharacterized protein n=1 Tax=Rosa chinensis TaxID=74649 RepID=A0A2P6SD96_ROSCH|nr:hypothetical protein RchiOBHm_Chr1g0339471 [Rosa chinensis]